METNLHAAFTGHRTYDGRGDAALRALLDAMYARGFRTFLSGGLCKILHNMPYVY